MPAALLGAGVGRSSDWEGSLGVRMADAEPLRCSCLPPGCTVLLSSLRRLSTLPRGPPWVCMCKQAHP